LLKVFFRRVGLNISEKDKARRLLADIEDFCQFTSKSLDVLKEI
jgi:hypothetical protein